MLYAQISCRCRKQQKWMKNHRALDGRYVTQNTCDFNSNAILFKRPKRNEKPFRVWDELKALWSLLQSIKRLLIFWIKWIIKERTTQTSDNDQKIMNFFFETFFSTTYNWRADSTWIVQVHDGKHVATLHFQQQTRPKDTLVETCHITRARSKPNVRARVNFSWRRLKDNGAQSASGLNGGLIRFREQSTRIIILWNHKMERVSLLIISSNFMHHFKSQRQTRVPFVSFYGKWNEYVCASDVSVWRPVWTIHFGIFYVVHSQTWLSWIIRLEFVFTFFVSKWTTRNCVSCASLQCLSW